MALVRPTPMSDPAAVPLAQKRTRRRLRLFIVFMASAAIVFLLIRFSGSLLVSESDIHHADFAILADSWSDRCLSSASERMKSGSVKGILLFSRERQRLELLGVISPGEELCRNKLIEQQVALEAIQSINGSSRSDWQTARLIDTWLDKHPGKRVIVLCERFSSRRWSYIFDRTIDGSNRSRLTTAGIADHRFDETNWWRSRSGIKSYFHNVFRVGYAWLHGEDSLPPIDWSPDKYESSLLK